MIDSVIPFYTILFHFSYLLFLCRIECCYMLSKYQKAVKKAIYRLSTQDVKKSVRRWEPLHCTLGGRLEELQALGGSMAEP